MAVNGVHEISRYKTATVECIKAFVLSICIILSCNAQTARSLQLPANTPTPAIEQADYNTNFATNLTIAPSQTNLEYKKPKEKKQKNRVSQKNRIKALSRNIVTHLKTAKTMFWGQNGWQQDYLRRFMTFACTVLGGSLAKDMWSQHAIKTHTQPTIALQVGEPPINIEALLEARENRLCERNLKKQELTLALAAFDKDNKQNYEISIIDSRTLADLFVQKIIDGKLEEAEALIADESAQSNIQEEQKIIRLYILLIRNTLENKENKTYAQLPNKLINTQPLSLTVEQAHELIKNQANTIINNIVSNTNLDLCANNYVRKVALIKSMIKLNDIYMMDKLVEVIDHENILPWILSEEILTSNRDAILSHVVQHNHFNIMVWLMQHNESFVSSFWGISVQQNNKQAMALVLPYYDCPLKYPLGSLAPILDNDNLGALVTLIRHLKKINTDINEPIDVNGDTILDRLVCWELSNTLMAQFLINEKVQSRNLISFLNSPPCYFHPKSQNVMKMLIAERDALNIDDYMALYAAKQYQLMQEAEYVIFDNPERVPLVVKERMAEFVTTDSIPRYSYNEITDIVSHGLDKYRQAQWFLLDKLIPMPPVLLRVVHDYAAVENPLKKIQES